MAGIDKITYAAAKSYTDKAIEEGGGGGGGSSKLSEAITSTVEVGGAPSGTTFDAGTYLEDVLRKILVKYIAPGLTMSLSPSTTPLLNGDSVDQTEVNAVVTKKSNSIVSVTFKVNGETKSVLTEKVSDGGSFRYYYEESMTSTTKFEVVVDDGSTGASASKTITFCDATYYGTVGSDVTEATEEVITALNKKAVNSKGMTYSDISMDYGKIVYAYPKSFGALSSIKDANNVDYIKSYTKTEVEVGGVTYYAYLLTDAAGVSGFKQIYA